MNKIKIGKSDETLPDWTTTKQNIPQWYKDISAMNEKTIAFGNEDLPKLNVKSCIPFLDALISGYTINLWCDVHFEQNEDGSHYIRWGKGSPVPIGFRDQNENLIPVPTGYTPYHYVWILPYSFSLPPGYSALLLHPLNRLDLPFIGMSGIVDADPVMNGGNFPFFIKQNFTGTIPAGTPIIQVIPFKRENWKMENSKEVEKIAQKYCKESNRKFMGFYKQNTWKRKKYE